RLSVGVCTVRTTETRSDCTDWKVSQDSLFVEGITRFDLVSRSVRGPCDGGESIS
ncbi:hypothetical protein WG66_006816, partial [Moniliophthora roreri]